jgi:DNA-binding response OmpR family regulator
MAPRILVLEREPDLALVLDLALASVGYDVCIVPDLREAGGLPLARPDLVLLGLVPDDDGPALCARLLTLWPAAKLVVLTTNPLPAAGPTLRTAGAHACVLEPFELDDLVAEVGRLLWHEPDVAAPSSLQALSPR